MRSEVSRGLVVVGGFVLLTFLFSGCQSRMAACDGEPLVEKTVKSLDKLSVARWTVATRIDKPSWQQQYYKDYISSYCGSKAVSNQVMATARLSKPGESSLPVKVSISSNCKNDDGTLTDIWNVPAYLTLGTLPVMESEKVTYTIRAVTVVGSHEKTVEIGNRRWVSLFTPLAMIPVPGWADFRTLELGDSGPSGLKEYHEKTIAASVVQLLSETAEEDWPKYINNRAQYDKTLSLERSDEVLRAAFDLIKDIRRDEAVAMREGKVVKFSKYNRKGKYRGERYKVVDHPCISEYQEYDTESEAKKEIANSTFDLRRRREQVFEKISRAELKVVERLAEVKEVDIIERYEEQIKKEATDARSEELKEALSNLLDKVRLKRKRIEAEELVAQRNWKQLRELCADEKDGEFVSTYSPKAEAFRVEELRKEMKDALTKGDWQHALTLSKDESDELVKELAAKAEQIRLTAVHKEVNDALSRGDWQHALLLSRNESDETIKALAVKAEQRRVEVKRIEINNALASRDWETALKLCQGEKDETIKVLEKKADKLRDSIKNEKLIECRKLLAEKKWDEVITIASKESDDEFGEILEQSKKAKNAAIHEARVAKAKRLFADGKWQELADLCKGERSPELIKMREKAYEHIHVSVEECIEEQIAMPQKTLEELIGELHYRIRTGNEIYDKEEFKKHRSRVFGKKIVVAGVVKKVWMGSKYDGRKDVAEEVALRKQILKEMFDGRLVAKDDEDDTIWVNIDSFGKNVKCEMSGWGQQDAVKLKIGSHVTVKGQCVTCDNADIELLGCTIEDRKVY